jgi:hypothetical protein
MNAARLENASWRTWLKAKNNLKTVSPETLNWYVIVKLVFPPKPIMDSFSPLLPLFGNET